MNCEIREKTFKTGNREITLAIIAFCTGTGKVVMVASSTHRRLKMDFATTTDKMVKLWKDDRKELIKLAFALELARKKGRAMKETHDEFFELFSELPVESVTAFQGFPEWHIARRLSLTSTTTHALIKALLRHYYDLEHDYIRTVCEFMCKNYDYNERMRERTRSEEEDTEAEQQYHDEDADEELDNLPEIYTDEYLLSNELPNGLESWEHTELLIRQDILKFKAGTTSLDAFIAYINSKHKGYLKAFLKWIGMHSE